MSHGWIVDVEDGGGRWWWKVVLDVVLDEWMSGGRCFNSNLRSKIIFMPLSVWAGQLE